MSLALQQGTGQPDSQLYKAIHRVADRLEPQFRSAFLEAFEQARGRIDATQLLNALKRKDIDAVLQALGTIRTREALRRGIEEAYRRGVAAGFEATSEEAIRAGLFEASFRSVNPNAVMVARRDIGTLITRIDDETRLAVRGVVSDMFTSGVPPAKASPRLRSLLGLNRPQAGYVRHFTALLEQLSEVGPDSDRFHELLAKATDRRLDAVTKGRIRKAAREGRLTTEAIDEFQDTYASSLRNRRALNVARTESLRAGHAGQQETWRQAVDRGQLSKERTRRRWIVTPDDRLRPSHAAIPSMNQGGVMLDEAFETPMGNVMHPPAGVNCRCSVGLTFVGRRGTL